MVTINIRSALAFVKDEQFQKDLNASFNHQVYLWQESMMTEIIEQQDVIVQCVDTNDETFFVASLSYHEWIQDNNTLASVKLATE